jgi:hypothetical protein
MSRLRPGVAAAWYGLGVVWVFLGSFAIGVMLGSVAFASEPLPADKLRSAVVRVENGTGFIAKGKSGKTYLVTNWHVAQSSRHRGTDLGPRCQDGRCPRPRRS